MRGNIARRASAEKLRIRFSLQKLSRLRRRSIIRTQREIGDRREEARIWRSPALINRFARQVDGRNFNGVTGGSERVTSSGARRNTGPIGPIPAWGRNRSANFSAGRVVSSEFEAPSSVLAATRALWEGRAPWPPRARATAEWSLVRGQLAAGYQAAQEGAGHHSYWFAPRRRAHKSATEKPLQGFRSLASAPSNTVRPDRPA